MHNSLSWHDSSLLARFWLRRRQDEPWESVGQVAGRKIRVDLGSAASGGAGLTINNLALENRMDKIHRIALMSAGLMVGAQVGLAALTTEAPNADLQAQSVEGQEIAA